MLIKCHWVPNQDCDLVSDGKGGNRSTFFEIVDFFSIKPFLWCSITWII